VDVGILKTCKLDDHIENNQDELKKAVSIIKRLIKSNTREGWEDSEHYNVVLDVALDFVSDIETHFHLDDNN